MLKITRLDAAGEEAVFKLEGRLVGPWVAELRGIAQTELAQDRRLALDVSALSFLDRKGEELLRELVHRRVRLESPTGFIQELLKGTGGSR